MSFWNWLFGKKEEPVKNTSNKKQFYTLKNGAKFNYKGQVARKVNDTQYAFDDTPDVLFNFWDTYFLLDIISDGQLDGNFTSDVVSPSSFVRDSNFGGSLADLYVPEPVISYEAHHPTSVEHHHYSDHSPSYHSDHSSSSYDSGGSSDSGGGGGSDGGGGGD